MAFHRLGPAPWDYSILAVPLAYAIHIVGQSVQKEGFIDIELYASGNRTSCRINVSVFFLSTELSTPQLVQYYF